MDIPRLKKLYEADLLSMRQIAVQLDVSEETVRRSLQKAGVAIRKTGRHDDLTGKQFGNYIVVCRVASTTENMPRWKCSCGCGNTREVNSNALKSERAQSCGACQFHCLHKDFHELPGAYWTSIKGHAKRRGISFVLTMEEAWTKFEAQQRCCALTGVSLCFAKNWRKAGADQTASLDRVDSNVGYTLANVQWVHKEINYMKNTMDQSEFISRCKSVVTHMKP